MTLFVGYLFAYLVNSVWQAPLLYAAASAACRFGRPWTPESKHRIWTFTFLAQILLPASCLLPASAVAKLRRVLFSVLDSGDRNADGNVRVILGDAHVIRPSGFSHILVPVLAALYAASVAFFACRFLYQLWRIHRLRHHCRPAVLTPACQRRWDCLCHRFQLPDAGLRLSAEISGPVTIGITHKLLIMPARFLAVPPSELDAGFAHELAHMRRNDYVKNLAYELLFLFAAYHPCVRFARAWLAETREMVCDAMAARALGGAEPYAHALLRLAAFCLPNQPAVPTQAIGIFDVNTSERRLMSLKAPNPQAS